MAEPAQHSQTPGGGCGAPTRVMPRISGVGLTTPLGIDLPQTWEALLAGRYIRDHSLVPLQFDPDIDRTIHLAIRAVAEALYMAGWPGEMVADGQTALVVGTSKGPVQSWLSPPPGHFARPLCGIDQIASAVAAKFGFGPGPRLTCSAACASGLLALIRACLMIRTGECRRAVVVATESSVHPLFLGSFARLGILPGREIGCRPFDEARYGFLMSEASATVCIEASEGLETDSEPHVIIDRYAMGGDAHHLTANDPAGVTLRRIVREVAGCQSIDLVHAHGTGTETNDPVELAAIDCAVPAGDIAPILYSHKAALGHSLGASGLVAVALNWMAHQTGRVPGNVRTERPLPAERVVLSSDAQSRFVQRSMALCAGFGGPVAGIRLQSCPGHRSG